MATASYYDILGVSPQASQRDIKQAYRQLAKRFHPDGDNAATDSAAIARINAAYEVLRDPQRRQAYDRQQLDPGGFKRGQARTAAQASYQRQRQADREAVRDCQNWLRAVYAPLEASIRRILDPLEAQLDALAADPFDERCMEAFQAYLDDCHDQLQQAQGLLVSQAHPVLAQGAAECLMYCLERIRDGLEELAWFPLSYDEGYLHAGRALFGVAERLLQEARASARAPA
ncbi:MAG: molecular chaperone DnaJ [Cyanobacteria bacterium QS_8_64_29]|nr:MAG: molecular chaperone DnaJ [Cyanobacteria bacterium QS_8_64_29]